MSCKSCYNGCNGSITSDTCVKYTGEDIPELGICTGDNLSSVESVIIEKLQEFAKGDGIDLSDLSSTCNNITDTSLKAIIQAILDDQCTLHDLVTSITPVNYAFDTTCLGLIKPNPTRDDILQGAIYKICSDSKRITAIENDYVKASLIDTIIQNYLDGLNGGSGVTLTQYSSRMVPFVAYPYHGQLSNFDGSGAGYSTLGFANVYICNGANGTPDYRGRSPIGSNSSTFGGAALDSAVNPTLSQNQGYTISTGTKVGEYAHALTSTENAAHTHTVTDTGHSHYTVSTTRTGSKYPTATDYTAISSNSSNGNQDYDLCKTSNPATVSLSSTTQTGITLQSSGNGTAHNTVQPSIGCVFIMYVP